MHSGNLTITVLFSALLSLALHSCYQTEHADLVVHNAVIHSFDPDNTTYQAMAIRDGKIVEMGAERQILNRYRTDRKVDAQTRVIYPGFYDAHAHFLGYARNKAELNLYGVESEQEMMNRVFKFAETTDRNWIVGRGWDQNLWKDKSFPTRRLLDIRFPDRPVVLTRIDGHAALANGAALRAVGIDSTTFIPGGAMLKNPDGSLTGVLIDLAAERVNKAVPPLDEELLIRLIAEAESDCFSYGLTTVSDAGLSVEDIRFLDRLHREENLKLRSAAMVEPGEESLEFIAAGPMVTDRLTARSVKLYADGALGSRGAYLKEPYADDPGNRGLRLLDDSTYHVYAEAALENGFQLCTHCIGDSANAFVLDLYARSLGGINDLRWRIEHAQVVSPQDRHYFADFGIIPSVQPIHATSDMAWAETRLGPVRIQDAYAFKSLKEELGIIAIGTDFPVEGMSPVHNFYAAVFRKNAQGQPDGGFQIDQALTREDALRAMTIWAALANFEEDRKGSLEVGKDADFILLDRDLLKVPEKDVLGTRVLGTWIKGERVFTYY